MNINIRNKSNYKGKGEYIGRGSPLGNPYKITPVQSRKQSIDMYKSFIIDAIKNEGFASCEHQNIISELNRLFSILICKQSLNLICWCYPKECHGDIIKTLLLNKYYHGDWLNNTIGICN